MADITPQKRVKQCLQDVLKSATDLDPGPPTPRTDPATHLSAIVRSVCVIRDWYLDTEERLAPRGALRAWRRFWIRLALIVGIPVLVGAGIMWAVGLLVGALVALLTQILALLATLAAIVLIIALLAAWGNRQ